MSGWTREALAVEIIRLASESSDPTSKRGQQAIKRLLQHHSWDELADRFHSSVLPYLELDCEWKESLRAEPGQYNRVYQNW